MTRSRNEEPALEKIPALEEHWNQIFGDEMENRVFEYKASANSFHTVDNLPSEFIK